MRLIRWYRCLVLFGALLLKLTESWSQIGYKPLDNLSQLSAWYPVHSLGSSRSLPISSVNPYAYATLDDLLQKVKEGRKVEALNLDSHVLKVGRLERLRQLVSVRILYVNINGSTPKLVDSLCQVVQEWPNLERLVFNVNPDYSAKVGPNQQFSLPASIQRFSKLYDVQIGGLGIQWDASLKALAELKTLRHLTLNSWGSPSAGDQSIHFIPMPQLVGVKISGHGFTVKSGMFTDLSHLKELILFNTRVDTTTFERTLAELPNLETVVVEGVQLAKNQRFGELKKLKTLELTNISNLVLASVTFAGLSGLERLVIHSIQANDLSALCSLSGLHTLIISGQGKAIQLSDCIGKLNQLTELRLERMTIGRLPQEIGSLLQLKKVSLAQCRLDSLPSTIDQLTTLEELNLEGNKLQQVPDLSKLRMLDQLNLSSNQLTALPDNIGQLTKLRSLNVAGNQLTRLPGTLTRLVALRTLNLFNNPLQQLPDDFGKLRKLQTLSLQNLPIVSLPASFDQLDSLQNLFLGYNRLKSLPITLPKLKNLTTLRIEKNELTTLPATIGGLTSLTALSINANPLTELPASITQLRNLRSLTISGTQVRLLPDEIGNLTKLENVNLSNNELIALPNSIGNWQHVTGLLLDKNRLEGLPNGIGRLTKLANLQISGKDKVTEGSVGGLRQLPDSIIHCAQLWMVSIERQPELDATDVLTKATHWKNLTLLKIVESNVSRLPAIDWKEVNWQTLILERNLLTELPVGLLEAPFLQMIIVGQNRLPEVLNRSFVDKETLQVSFVEAGALPREQLPKPSRKVAMAYQQLSMQKAGERDWEGALSNLDKAVEYAPDTTRAFTYGQRATFFRSRKQYPEALADYDKAIEYSPWAAKDKFSDSLTTKRMMASFWQQKAGVLGITGQYDAALTALTQAESQLPNTDNTTLSGLVHTERGRYLTLKNKFVEADSSYRKAIRAYEKLTHAQPGTQLTVVELSLLTGQYDRALRAIANIPANQLNSGYDVLKEYLENCLMVLKDEQDGSKATERLSAYLGKHPTKVYGWSFDLFDNWLTKSKLPAEKVTALRQLTDATKERLVKPQ